MEQLELGNTRNTNSRYHIPAATPCSKLSERRKELSKRGITSLFNHLSIPFQRHLPVLLLLLPLLLSASLTCARSAHDSAYRGEDSAAGRGFSSGTRRIPGLYDQSSLITPVQGQEHFERLVLGRPSESWVEEQERPLMRPNETYVNLVQFYMATCPDCQGFSPYFKRLVSDIGPHWRKIVRVVVVNCNDDLNINVCWQQNPVLFVPLVRWYAFPDIQLDSRRDKLFAFPEDLLNVAHRGYVEKQRRDLISLRHATLRYINSILDQLSFHPISSDLPCTRSNQTDCPARKASEKLYTSLPIAWKLLQELGRRRSHSSVATFLEDLEWRVQRCVIESGQEGKIASLENYIVFEQPNSYAGRTLVADWSNWVCAANLPAAEKKLLLVHYTTDLSLLNHMIMTNEDEPLSLTMDRAIELQPLLFSFNVSLQEKHPNLHIDQLRLKLLAANGTLDRNNGREKRHTVEETSPKLARRSQWVTLERYSTKGRSLDSIHRLSFKYASSMTTTDKQASRIRRSISNATIRQLHADNINWAPEELYPKEEALRYEFNEKIAKIVFGPGAKNGSFAGFPDGNQAELVFQKPNTTSIMKPYDDDTTHVRLTDYYKVLADIVHKNVIYKAEFDGYQYLASTCFLRTLALHFPYQGSGSGNRKSISHHFIDLVQRQQADELKEKVGELAGCRDKLNLDDEARNAISKLRLPRNHLEKIQSDVSKKYDIGLPAAGHFNWTYCAGSSEYLRGYTCSLWVLFHTLTVHEYLKDGNATLERSRVDGGGDVAQETEYKFSIHYSDNHTLCDPRNPEPAFLNSTSELLFVKETHLALANIINFVRFYLPCANCAAHFSCMVHNSMIDFEKPRPDDHLLWLWEGHNRVNMRTKNTHSEDPHHPKHVFPVYEACPECYLKKPEADTWFTDMSFNRQQLVNFLVARYRRSAILNNKIRIEDLYHKPVDGRSASPAPR